MLTTNQAKFIAEGWAGGQSDLPMGVQTWARAYDATLGERKFAIVYVPKALGKEYCLVELAVRDDGTVHILTDNRNDLEQISYDVGDATESRFFTALGIRTAQTPIWFQKVKPAHRLWDIRGIDAFAYVDYREGERRLKIPVQIKSSATGAKHYYEIHQLCKEHGVHVIVVKSTKTDDQLRQSAYAALGGIRKRKMKDGTRFKDLYELLLKSTSPRG